MRRQQLVGCAALLLAAVTAMAAGAPRRAEQMRIYEERTAYEQMLAATPVAGIDGDAMSPDGRFVFRTEGERDVYVSGLRPPERLALVDNSTGKTVWQTDGTLRHSVLWSSDSHYAAVVTAGRMWNCVTVIETRYFSACEVTMPDGGPIPEYAFLPGEDWGRWDTDGLGSSILRLIIDGGDGEEIRTYRCCFSMDREQIGVSLAEEERETLPGDWDFDHDGGPETVELTTLWAEEQDRRYSASYELRVINGAGASLYQKDFADAHAGWGSLFALTLDDQDCLLWYQPWMGQGAGCYCYQLFSLESGWTVLGDGLVEFDVNFGSFAHLEYDPEAIAAFLREVHGYLDGSTLLFSTEGGSPQKNLLGAEFWADDFTGGALRDSDNWEETLREFEKNFAL